MNKTYKYVQVRLSQEEYTAMKKAADRDAERGGPGTLANQFRKLLAKVVKKYGGEDA